MRIFLISRGYPTKREPQWGCFEKDQAEALAKYGHEVVMLSVDTRFRWYWRKIGITVTNNNGVTSVNNFFLPSKITGLLGRKIRTSFEHWQLRRVYKKSVKLSGVPDVLYSHYIQISNMALTLKRHYNIPLIAIEHWSEMNKDVLSKYAKTLGKNTYKYADAVLTVSPSIQESLKKHFDVNANVVFNIVGQDFHYNPNTCKASKFTFISIGSLIVRKRVDLAIEAFAQLNIPKDSWEYIIIGGGPEHSNLQKLINECNLQGNIYLLGLKTKKEIVDLLQHSHAFILSSQLETFSVVCIEALACGVPVIATKCGGPEFFIRQEDGILISVNNLQELANALHHMFLHHQDYDRKLIAEDCQKRFGAETIAKQLTDVFESVVNKRT